MLPKANCADCFYILILLAVMLHTLYGIPLVSCNSAYGSGIRRAKNAMKENGSPELVFEPSNDTDDYTMVTAYINEEFARIQTEENEKNNRQEKSKDFQIT